MKSMQTLGSLERKVQGGRGNRNKRTANNWEMDSKAFSVCREIIF